jgi:tyrosinase
LLLSFVISHLSWSNRGGCVNLRAARRIKGHKLTMTRVVARFPRIIHHTLFPPRPAMLILRFFSVVLATFWSATDEPYRGSDRKTSCTNPVVRREWRKLGAHEKAEWIGAVNVRHMEPARSGWIVVMLMRAIFGWQCLAHLPHDPALAPSVDPSISQIPPINPSGSFYDGIILSNSSLSRSFNHISTDLVYVHMDLSTQVRPGSI